MYQTYEKLLTVIVIAVVLGMTTYNYLHHLGSLATCKHFTRGMVSRNRICWLQRQGVPNCFEKEHAEAVHTIHDLV